MTNPCTDCKIETRLYPVNVAATTKMGQTISFGDKSSVPMDYNIVIRRTDTTLLKTHHTGTWYINK